FDEVPLGGLGHGRRVLAAPGEPGLAGAPLDVGGGDVAALADAVPEVGLGDLAVDGPAPDLALDLHDGALAVGAAMLGAGVGVGADVEGGPAGEDRGVGGPLAGGGAPGQVGLALGPGDVGVADPAVPADEEPGGGLAHVAFDVLAADLAAHGEVRAVRERFDDLLVGGGAR